jgi:hypothetical protein
VTIPNGKNTGAKTAMLIAPTPPESGCYVIQMIPSGREDLGGQAYCNELPEEFRDSITSTCRTWREGAYIAKNLRHMLNEREIQGMAIVYQPYQRQLHLEIPKPLNVFFEPVEMDEFDSHLQELIDINVPPESIAGHHQRKRSRWRRFLVYYGLPLGIMLKLIFQAVLQSANHFRNWYIGSVVAMLLMIIGVKWIFRDHWMLVPGGLILRKAWVRDFRTRSRNCAPANSTLIIRPLTRGFTRKSSHIAWQAEIWQDELISSRPVTCYEASALLAAWQSKLRAPTSSDVFGPVGGSL